MSKPVSIAVADKDMAIEYVEWDDRVEELWNAYFPGPYTLILPKRKTASLPEGLGEKVGIRNPNYPLLLAISKELGKPVIATSANVSGKPSRYNLDGLEDEMNLSLVDFVDDQGQLPDKPPSTLVEYDGEDIIMTER